jgi:hypothetical protein
MFLAPAPNSDITPGLIEGGLTAILFVAAFIWPRLGSSSFSRIERAAAKLARRKGLAVAVVGLAALLLRLAILPICPIPLPFAPDDFSFLLAADTFAHGHLTNPTPAMWTHFETIHITMQPTYMSMYFPAQGLLLAAGKVLFGQPWYGLLIASALMCASICWMLQAWLPATWALLGGLIAVVHLGLFSYWINTYHAAGSICALGGALVLGALPRLIKTSRSRYGLLLAVGIVLIAVTRPYEGVLLCLPVAAMLGHWILVGKNRPSTRVLIRRAAFPLALIAASGAWMGYYDYRAFGSPLTLPYTVDRATYAMAPYFVWQSPRPEPVYRHAVMRSFYYVDELDFFSKIHSLSGFLPNTLLKVCLGLTFFTGAALLPPLIMLRRTLLDRRIRFLVLCVLVLIAGMGIQIYLIPHYLAPFTAAFYAIGLQAMRHLRLWNPEDKPVGVTLVRLTVTFCFLMVGIRLYAGPLHLALPEFPVSYWNFSWYGPDHFGTEHARVENDLDQLPGKQLVIVRYSPLHNPLNEWVYNAADIDGAKIVWAREMNAAANLELMRYYKDRNVWLVQPDFSVAEVTPYPTSGQPGSGAQ